MTIEQEDKLQEKIDALTDMIFAQREYKRALFKRASALEVFLRAFPDIDHTSVEGMIKEAGGNG